MSAGDSDDGVMHDEASYLFSKSPHGIQAEKSIAYLGYVRSQAEILGSRN